MSCCGARKNHRIRWCSILFDRGHSLLLASSATGSARKRPRFDTSPYMLNSFQSITHYSIFYRTGRSVMPCPSTRKVLTLLCKNFNRGQSACLATIHCCIFFLSKICTMQLYSFLGSLSRVNCLKFLSSFKISFFVLQNRFYLLLQRNSGVLMVCFGGIVRSRRCW